jgi:hypothetical protein
MIGRFGLGIWASPSRRVVIGAGAMTCGLACIAVSCPRHRVACESVSERPFIPNNTTTVGRFVVSRLKCVDVYIYGRVVVSSSERGHLGG